MLHKDIRDAVKKRKFNIYLAEQVEDFMWLLSGLEPGEVDASGDYPPKSFNYLVQQRIKKLQRMQKIYTQHNGEGDSTVKSDTEQ